MQNVQVAAGMRTDRRATKSEKIRRRSPPTGNENRAQDGSESATAGRSGEHISAISPFRADFADAVPTQVNLSGFGVSAIALKRLANEFVLVRLFKDARKCERGHDRYLPSARYVLLHGLPIADGRLCQSSAGEYEQESERC
jgi:hypothetical protein